MDRQGFSLLETTLATVVVSVLLVSSVSSLGTAMMVLHSDQERVTADSIGGELIAEICSCAYQDPENGVKSFGPEESSASRDAWDDCDDYHGWKSSNLTRRGGDLWSVASGWSASVSVTIVNPIDGAAVSSSTCKKIVVQLTSPRSTQFEYASFRAGFGLEPSAALSADTRINRVEINAKATGRTSQLSAVLSTGAVEQ